MTLPSGHLVLAIGWETTGNKDELLPMTFSAAFEAETGDSSVLVERTDSSAGASGWEEWTIPIPESLANRRGRLNLDLVTRPARLNGESDQRFYLARPITVAKPAGAKRPNIILISIDTLRSDRLGCYGHSRPTSPAPPPKANSGRSAATCG